MAHLVWCMPQYSLGTAALRQNLSPELLGGMNEWVSIAILFGITGVVIWCYDAGGWGVRVFEWVLKGMVAVIVLAFARSFGAQAREESGQEEPVVLEM